MEVCMHLPIIYSTQGTNILLYQNNQLRFFMDKHPNKISDCFGITWIVSITVSFLLIGWTE